MNISRKWLQDYVKTTSSAQTLAERLILSTAEVEGIANWSQKLQSIVIGKVISVEDHPQASKLHITQVDVGQPKPIQIVCGADNVQKGLTVAVALPGASVTSLKGEALLIQPVKLRGERSEGMLCAASELGLPIDAGNGIWELDSKYHAGSELAQALELDDSILDLTITLNRPDLLSYTGIAREVATLEHHPFIEPEILSLEPNNQSLPNLIELEIQPASLCKRISGIVLKVEQNQSSPWWLQARLIKSGMRPVNAVVDITNYCMLELGQPLHAYDLNKVAPKANGLVKLIAAESKGSQQLLGLDGRVRELELGDTVITNAQLEPLCIAGIMGGEGSAVSSNSQLIILEAANFDGHKIRKTSKRLGLRTESSLRFEKGQDPELTVTAIKRAAWLFQQLGIAKPASQLVDVRTNHRIEKLRIAISTNRIQDVLGVHISIPEAKLTLQKLGFQIQSLTKSALVCLPPSWRLDIKLEEDVLEELIRVYGLERLPINMLSGAVFPPRPNPRFTLKKQLRAKSVNLGLQETVHGSFTNASSLTKLGLQPNLAIALASLYTQEETHLIPTHLLNFLKTVSSFQNQNLETRLFEIGHIFLPPAIEQARLSILLRSQKLPLEILFREGKGIMEQLLSEYTGQRVLDDAWKKEVEVEPYFAAHQSLSLSFQGIAVATLGVVAKSVVEANKIRSGKQIVFGSFNLDQLLKLNSATKTHLQGQLISTTERAITLIQPAEVPYQEIEAKLQKRPSQPLELSVRLVDVYQGPPLLPDQKSYSFAVKYGAKDHTITDAEVETAFGALEQYIQTAFYASETK